MLLYSGEKSNSTAMPGDKEVMFYINGPGAPPFFLTSVYDSTQPPFPGLSQSRPFKYLQ